MMASVYEVYLILKDLTNKDARGMVTPSQFNSFAGVAQTRVFNGLFSEIQSNKKQSIRQLDGGRDKNRIKQIQEDLSTFSKTSELSSPNGPTGTFTKPDDMSRIISMTTNGSWLLDGTTSERIQLVYDEEKIDMILVSTLSVPTESNPVALVSVDIQVFPTSINKIKLRYYKTPEGVLALTGVKTSQTPSFGYTAGANGQEVYDVNNTVDFELPNHYVPELVVEMAKLIGINLRQPDVYAYAVNEQQKQIINK